MESEQKKSKKGLKIVFFIIVGLMIVVAAAYFILAKSSTVSAQLNVEQGQVLVNDNAVQGDVKLKQGDIIETKQNSLATIILYESVVISLEENTKVSIDSLIKEHPEVTQQSGETWNTFTKLSGVEGYTVKSGNSIASVRATSFGIKQDYIIGGEGTVDYQVNGEDFSVSEEEVVDASSGNALKRAATAEEKQKIKAEMLRTIQRLKHLRELEIKKKPFVYEIIKKKTGFTDEEISSYLSDIDEEKINIDELASQSPIKLDTIDKAVEITRAIQKINRNIKG